MQPTQLIIRPKYYATLLCSTPADTGRRAKPMATYGYRLFTIELRKELGRKPVDFAECQGQHFLGVGETLLKALGATSTGRPKLKHGTEVEVDLDQQEEIDSEPEGLAGEPAFRVESYGRTGHVLHGTFFAGRFGEHEMALGAPDRAEDTDLDNRAPSRLHRFVMALPEEGTTGLLAIESIGRTCPVNLFIGWLARQSQVQADGSPVDAPLAEEKSSWWKLQWTPMADDQHLDNIIRAGKFSRIELIKHRITNDNRRSKEYFRLVAPAIQDESVAEIAHYVKDWWNRRRRIDPGVPPPTDNEAAGQLASIFGSNVEHLDFDDGFVVLENEGEKKSISPSRMSEVFIYPLSQDCRSDSDAFYRAIRSKAISNAQSARLDVQWPRALDWS